MTMRNLHKTYYKDYFGKVDFRPDKYDTETNRKAIGEMNRILMTKGQLFTIPDALSNATFDLTVIYPGLVTGTGITHETGIQGEFKLGMHFDYTYGMPAIYGSTVKGVLRSYFKDEYSGPDPDKAVEDIFEGFTDGKARSVYDRDIFFDAVIVSGFRDDDNAPETVLASDAITPHKDPLANPVPLPFLKIAPGCTVQFRFRLVDSIISAAEKKKIFRKILLNYGIGAKTNVGYGQLGNFE